MMNNQPHPEPSYLPLADAIAYANCAPEQMQHDIETGKVYATTAFPGGIHIMRQTIQEARE